MSDPALQCRSLRVFVSFLPKVSHLTIAVALCGFGLAAASAQANEYNPGPLFGAPGDGEPYRDRLHPRVLLAPMPERNPYSPRHHSYEPDEPTVYEAPLRRSYESAPIQAEDHGDYEPEKRGYAKDHEDHGPGKSHYRDDRLDRYPANPIDPAYRDDPGPDEDVADHDEDEDKDEKGVGFGRLFPNAVAEHDDGQPSYKALRALGLSMVETRPNDPLGDSEMPAGYTFLGQFIDHDLTLETTTDLGHRIEGDYDLKNARTPDLDLDSVYGSGPKVTPHLYRLPYIRVGRLVSGEDSLPRHDLFRTKSSYYYGPAGGDAVALLGDPRNDENIVISQLHAAFVALHNRTVDILVERDFGKAREGFCHPGSACSAQELALALPDDVKAKIFELAHDHVVHYYHRLIVDDFLPRVIGPRHTASLLKRGRDFFFPDGFARENGPVADIHIPVEFAVAAFRYGHSQVRESYVLRDGAQFDLLSNGRDGGPRAFTPINPHYLVDWRFFFDIDHKPPYGFNLSRRIDPELVKSLHQLHFSNVVGMHDVTSLASRNLARAKSLYVPSGQDVARIVLPALQSRGLLGKGDGDYRSRGEDEFWRAYLLEPDERVRYFIGEADTPLWYYILQEASLFGLPTRLRAVPYGGEDDHLSGDYPAKYGRRFLQPASLKYRGKPDHYEDADERDHYDGLDGGHRLGPVGATIVGEVLTGLVDHYRAKTGKGLDYHPQIKGSSSAFAGLDSEKASGHRYLMRNFLIDAGVVEDD
jgi:hypothetical protein